MMKPNFTENYGDASAFLQNFPRMLRFTFTIAVASSGGSKINTPNQIAQNNEDDKKRSKQQNKYQQTNDIQRNDSRQILKQ